MSGQVAENQGVIAIYRKLMSAVQAVTDRTNASDTQADDDFNRELADVEMSQVAGADPPDAPSYGDAGNWYQVATRRQGKRIISLMRRRRIRFND